MYKVFIYNKPVLFVEKSENINHDDVAFFDSKMDVLALKKTIYGQTLQLKTNSELFVRCDDLNNDFSTFKSMHKSIVAAGGVVQQGNKILFIFRNGKWDLPKGKLEKGEDILQCALREVEEECAISGLTILKKLPSTYHTYQISGTDILKTTHWYLMNYSGNETPIPQKEEGIQKVEWREMTNMEDILANTFESIKDFLSTSIIPDL